MREMPRHRPYFGVSFYAARHAVPQKISKGGADNRVAGCAYLRRVARIRGPPTIFLSLRITSNKRSFPRACCMEVTTEVGLWSPVSEAIFWCLVLACDPEERAIVDALNALRHREGLRDRHKRDVVGIE